MTLPESHDYQSHMTTPESHDYTWRHMLSSPLPFFLTHLPEFDWLFIDQGYLDELYGRPGGECKVYLIPSPISYAAALTTVCVCACVYV